MTAWRELLRAVPRRYFIPDTVWVDREDGYMVPLRQADDPQRWLALCDADEPIITQVDDGVKNRGIFPTSSSSAPFMMASMLEALDVGEHMQVLEIGTGTGYNAAVLAERVGAANVTTVEVDPAVAAHARVALEQAGYPVTVITGDGARGHVEGSPYDRIIATVAATEVPYAWVEQTRPAGKVVVPWACAFHPEGALLTLAVDEDGFAQGRFGERAAFMCLRAQRLDLGAGGVGDSDFTDTTTRLYPHELLDEDFEARFALGIQLPGCRHARFVENGAQTLRLSHPPSGSRASFTSGAEVHDVCQLGPRRLWDELESAYRWWVDAGRPDHTRFGMTVAPDGQRVWLDSPDHPPIT